MKKTFAIALILLIAAAAFAATGAAKLTVNNELNLNGTKVSAGVYQVTWTGDGDNAKVTLKNGKKEVTVPAKVTSLKDKVSGTTVFRGPDGKVTQIQLGGTNTSLVFGESGVKAD